MSPPTDSSEHAAPVAAVTPIRPPTLATLTADVAVETRIVRDLAGLVGTVLSRTTEGRDLAALAKSEASQAKAIAARVEREVVELREEVQTIGRDVADASAAIVGIDLRIAARVSEQSKAIVTTAVRDRENRGAGKTAGAAGVVLVVVEVCLAFARAKGWL